mgnify:CR=1 FL=1
MVCTKFHCFTVQYRVENGNVVSEVKVVTDHGAPELTPGSRIAQGNVFPATYACMFVRYGSLSEQTIQKALLRIFLLT